MLPRAYLAGPDVFLPDPISIADKKKVLCSRYGFEGVFPLDADIDLTGLSPREAGTRISQANEALIRSAHLLIAHITPFRGPSADVGTAFEMGFARAIGLPIYAYSNERDDFTSRTVQFLGTTRRRPSGEIEDEDGMAIESFGLIDNLMIAGAVECSKGCVATTSSSRRERFTLLEAFENCLSTARQDFARS